MGDITRTDSDRNVDWLSPLGPVVNALLAAVAADLTILVGQRVLGNL
jgi:hypothetical protein